MISNTQRTTYEGTQKEFDGVPFRWDGSQYVEVSSVQTEFADNSGIQRKVRIPFKFSFGRAKISVDPKEIQVAVDNLLWEDVVYEQDRLIVIFDESFILNQRNIRFKSDRKISTTRYVIKARVYESNDVVLMEYNREEEPPVIGEIGDSQGHLTEEQKSKSRDIEIRKAAEKVVDEETITPTTKVIGLPTPPPISETDIAETSARPQPSPITTAFNTPPVYESTTVSTPTNPSQFVTNIPQTLGAPQRTRQTTRRAAAE